MPIQDKWSQYETDASPVSAPETASPEVSSNPSQPDKWSQYEVGNAPASTVQPTSFSSDEPKGGVDKWSQYEVDAPKNKPLEDVSKEKPLAGGGEPSNPNDPWYKKVWDWVNEPLVDEQSIEKMLGREGHAGGFEKGFYDIVAGLSSPLSLALTIGTLPFGGEGGLLESGGAAALKTAGVLAKDLPEVVKGSKLIADAIKVGKTAEDAYALMPGKGINAELVANSLKKLTEAGMSPESLYNTGVVRRVGGSMLRQAGISPATADKVSHWVQFAVDSGFTAQNAYGAIVSSPKVLDAIKEGDYETAKRLAVDVVGGGAFAALGAANMFHQAGELRGDAAASAGLQVKPSESTLELIKAFEPYAGDIVAAGQKFKDWSEAQKKAWNDLPKEERILAQRWVETGQSKEGMDRAANLIAKAAGRDVPDAPLPNVTSALDEMLKQHDFIKDHAFRVASTPADYAKLAKFQDGQVRELLAKVETYSSKYGLDKDEFANYIQKTKDALAKADTLTSSQQVTATQDRALGFLHRFIDEAKAKESPKEYYHGTTHEFAKSAKENGIIPKAQSELEEPKAFLTDDKAYARQYPSTPGPRAIMVLDGSKIEGLDAKDVATTREAFTNKTIPKEAIKQIRYYDAEGRLTDLDQVRPEPPMLDKHVADLAEEMNLKSKPKSYVDDLLKQFDSSKVTDRHIEFARMIRDQFNENLENAKKNKALKEGVDDYFTRIWKKPDNDTVRKFQVMSGHNGFSTNTDMARHRVFQSTLEGLLKGYELENHDPIDLAAHNGNEFARVIAARKVLDHIQDKGTTASDGRPLLAASGSGSVVEGEEGENPAILADPNTMRSIRIANKIIEGYQSKGQLEGLVRRGQITQIGVDKRTQKPIYAWTTSDYKSVGHPAFDHWNWATEDSNGHPVLVKGELKVHPEGEEYLKRRLGLEKSTISQKLKPVLAAGQEAKGMLLFLSPFHAMQEGLRALMTGVNPWGIEKYNDADPFHRMAAEKGVLENWGNAKALFQEGLAGHSKILSKIPGLAQIQDWYQGWLFDKYLPGLKMRSFKSLYERYASANKDWTPDKVAKVAAADTNSRFGGLSYQRMGRSMATQDIARIVALAPDWLESELRFMARTFTPGGEGSIARKDVARAAIALWGAARVVNLLSTGNAHNEAPFGLALKDDDGKEKVYSIRTLPTDMLHAISDPEGFLKGRVAPLARVAAQTYTGRDEFGRKIPEHGMFVNLLRQVSPIPVQTAAKVATGETPDITSGDAALKASGFTVFPYRTEGQKKAAELASSHSEAGPVDEDKLKRHQAILEIENRVRGGRTPITDIYHMVENGAIHVDEAKQIVKNMKDTQGMDVDTARFYAHVSRLPMKDVIDVWNTSSPQEHAAIAKLLIQKKNAYMKKAIKDMSPAERQNDQVYRWIRKNFPNDTPWGG